MSGTYEQNSSATGRPTFLCLLFAMGSSDRTGSVLMYPRLRSRFVRQTLALVVQRANRPVVAGEQVVVLREASRSSASPGFVTPPIRRQARALEACPEPCHCRRLPGTGANSVHQTVPRGSRGIGGARLWDQPSSLLVKSAARHPIRRPAPRRDRRSLHRAS